ncbi:F-box protein SKIP16-like [Juglans regia]|uniref:F-box protein SKIP16-like n=2 Tax=Juglans regia TaxID=51240 RepID=A0A2I4ET51_JUGRE|nr:F-box protein SKIP16-like [Juglans regia]
MIKRWSTRSKRWSGLLGPKRRSKVIEKESLEKRAERERETERDMGLESVGDLALHVILTKLGPKETATAACVNKKLRSLASEDSLWFKFCSQDLHLNHPLDPLGNSTPSFKVSYQLWREAFSMYPWLLVMRVNRCWGRLKNWLDINFPEAKATLCKGVSEADIQESERILKVKLPLPTRILYRFCDGQESVKQSLVSSHGSSLGLIGGYSFYQHFVNVYLLPLTEVILETKAIVRRPGFSRRSKYIVVAASSTYVEKFFFLNCTTGQLYVGTANLPTCGEMIPCVPNALISSVHDFNGDQQQDAMLLWLEEHVRRLENGVIKLREEGGFKSINLFPEDSPLCSTAITNGVKVRASAVFVPESADLQNENETYTFSYSIRMSLLPEGCVIHGICFSSCQLHQRHWIIRANDSVVSHVNGEAVIGQFPLLLPGGKEFVYESCTPLPTSLGSIEGSYTFVPGRLKNPKGAPFEVEVARVPLQLPDYIF